MLITEHLCCPIEACAPVDSSSQFWMWTPDTTPRVLCTTPRVLCRICPTRVKEPLKHPRYKSVIDGLITGADHLWLESCIVGQTENPLIKIPSTHGEALKSNCVLEIFELQSQVESIILLRMGEWIYNTLRRPKTAEVIHKKRAPSPHTTSVGTFSEHHIPPLQLVAS